MRHHFFFASSFSALVSRHSLDSLLSVLVWLFIAGAGTLALKNGRGRRVRGEDTPLVSRGEVAVAKGRS